MASTSTSRQPVMGSIYDIERARLQVEKDSFEVEWEQLLETRRINQNITNQNSHMQTLIVPSLHQQGLSVVSEAEN